MYFFNKGPEEGDFLGEVEAYGVASRIYILGQPPGAAVRVVDIVEYDWSRFNLPALVQALSRGLSIGRIEAKPEVLLKFVKMPRGVDKAGFLREGLALVRRWLLAYGPLTPLLAWDGLADLVVDPGPRIYVRVRGLGSYYIPLELEPSQDESVVRGLGEDLTLGEYLLNRVSERTRTPITAYNPRAMPTDAEFRLRVTAQA